MDNNFQKELLAEIIQKWDIDRVEEYIAQLEQKRIEMDDWIKHVRTIRKKKARRQPLENGTRGGKG